MGGSPHESVCTVVTRCVKAQVSGRCDRSLTDWWRTAAPTLASRGLPLCVRGPHYPPFPASKPLLAGVGSGGGG